MKIRVGFGYDVHKLENGLRFVLGGVELDHTKGLIAHSDGDVLLHAISDAILGALNMRDIGYHFPDTSQEFKNVDSRVLLRKVIALVTEKGWAIGNIDSTICLQKPKLLNYIPQMQSNIAHDLGVDIDDVSIKATTTEKLGFVGTEDGVAVYAVVLLQKN